MAEARKDRQVLELKARLEAVLDCLAAYRGDLQAEAAAAEQRDAAAGKLAYLLRSQVKQLDALEALLLDQIWETLILISNRSVVIDHARKGSFV